MSRKFERMIGIYNARQENEYYLPITHKQNKMEDLKETTVYIPLLVEDFKEEEGYIRGYGLTDLSKYWLKEKKLFVFDKEKLEELLTHLFEMGESSCLKKENYIKSLLL